MKSFLVLIILIFLTACINTRYYYYPENYKNNNISVSGNLVEFNNQNSPLNNIWILDLRDNYNEKHKAKILSFGKLKSFPSSFTKEKPIILSAKSTITTNSLCFFDK